MVYTLTVNPSVDYVLNIDNFEKGIYNRTKAENMLAGGRGVNISRILSYMGIECITLGFVGGLMGQLIKNILDSNGLKWSFVQIEGETRINIKIKSGDYDTIVNATGPVITDTDVIKMYEKLNLLTDCEYLFLAGSVRQPSLLNLYKILGEASISKGAKLIVDSDGDTLREMVKYKPFFIKPSIKELGIMFGTTIVTMDAVLNYGKKLVEMGAEHVIVSMEGSAPPLYFGKDVILTSTLPQGEVVNTTGAGDAMVGAFIGEMIKSGSNVERSFRMSIAAGSQTAFSRDLCTYDEMNALYENITTQVFTR